MRTLRPLPKFFMIMFILGVIIVLLKNCEKPVLDELYLEDSISSEELYPWQDLLQQLDLQSDILFVQNGESIQDAIDVANSGSVIYIEPGIYEEEISSNKPDIKLIGFNLEPDDLVINDAENENLEILNLHDKSNFDKLRNKSFRCGTGISIMNISREELGDKIAHYTFDMRIGHGDFNMVTIHRVVKEKRTFTPVKTKGDVFMVHGAIQNFDAIFLTAGAETITAETSSPYYLASNNIDVWGIDMGWTKVPMETTDFSFMESWGMWKDIDHTLKAMSIARLIRGLTRQGFSKMNLLGFSYGVHVAYGAASKETQQHKISRDIKGIIPVDNTFKSDNLNYLANICKDAAIKKNELKNGQYAHPWGVGIIGMGELAINDPDSESPFNSDFTNSEFLKFVGSQGFFAADQNGNYLYSDHNRFFRLAIDLAPYWPMQINYELSACPCPTEDVDYDKHLDKIGIPIYYIGAEMAAGQLGVYTSHLTASKDITNHIVPGYSHADLWLANDASNTVWHPLSQWLKNHRR